MFSIKNGFASCSTSLARVTCIPTFPSSEPIHLRLSFSATDRVVPEPMKKSATRSPSLEEHLMIFSNNSLGFCVSYPVRSFELLFKKSISHQSFGYPPSLRYCLYVHPG